MILLKNPWRGRGPLKRQCHFLTSPFHPYIHKICCFNLSCFFLIKLFEIIADLKAVVRNNAGQSHVPFTPFPPVVTSSSMILDITPRTETDRIHRSYSAFTNSTCTHLLI